MTCLLSKEGCILRGVWFGNFLCSIWEENVTLSVLEKTNSYICVLHCRFLVLNSAKENKCLFITEWGLIQYTSNYWVAYAASCLVCGANPGHLPCFYLGILAHCIDQPDSPCDTAVIFLRHKSIKEFVVGHLGKVPRKDQQRAGDSQFNFPASVERSLNLWVTVNFPVTPVLEIKKLKSESTPRQK